MGKGMYRVPDVAQVLMPITTFKPIPIHEDRRPIPDSIENIVHNVIRGVAQKSMHVIPTDREMKSLQIALEILHNSPKVSEALGRHKPFAPTIAAQLEEGNSKRQAIGRLRRLYAQALIPVSESQTTSESSTSKAKK